MKKKLITLSESDLHNIIKESVKRVINESQKCVRSIYYDMDNKFQDEMDELLKKYPDQEDEFEELYDKFGWYTYDKYKNRRGEIVVEVEYVMDYDEVDDFWVSENSKQEFAELVKNFQCNNQEFKNILLQAFDYACEDIEDIDVLEDIYNNEEDYGECCRELAYQNNRDY
jgi:hypothetical protein